MIYFRTFILVFTLGFSTHQVKCETISVCPDCQVRSIRAALSFAKPGDKILIKKGTYREGNLEINTNLIVQGEEGAIIEPSSGMEGIIVNADSVTIINIEIRNISVSYIKELSAIRVKENHHTKLLNNRLINTFFAIYLQKAKDVDIRGNIVQGVAKDEASSGNGIHAWYCSNLVIENNYFRGHRDGIYFEFVDKSLVKNNVSEKNLRYGLHYMFSNDDKYMGNTFSENGAGVAVMFSKNIDMVNNHFKLNWGRSSYGLLLKEITDAYIANNHFEKNTMGIHIEGISRISFQQNTFSNNGMALEITGGCLSSEFCGNNFMTNTLDMTLKGNINDNSFDGNYWSSYNGYDIDKDGFGDVPFRPVKLFSHVLNQIPESIILLRSLFIDIVDFAEKINPALTPVALMDQSPLINPL